MSKILGGKLDFELWIWCALEKYRNNKLSKLLVFMTRFFYDFSVNKMINIFLYMPFLLSTLFKSWWRLYIRKWSSSYESCWLFSENWSFRFPMVIFKYYELIYLCCPAHKAFYNFTKHLVPPRFYVPMDLTCYCPHCNG